MIIQLNPCIPVITPKGNAIAHLMIDDGIEYDLKWVCFQDDTGECWTWRNKFIRAQKNITEERENISPFYNPEDVAFDDSQKCMLASHMLHLRCSMCHLLDWVPCELAKDWVCPVCSYKDYLEYIKSKG